MRRLLLSLHDLFNDDAGDSSRLLKISDEC